MSFLSTLSFYDSLVMILYVVYFGMFLRLGFGLADWIMREYRWFVSCLLSRLTVHRQTKK